MNIQEGSPPDESLPGPPTLHPSMLDFGYVPLGSQKTLEQIIANATKQPMIWLADTPESGWLSVEPDHGVLQPGEQQSIRVTADSRSLEIGEHSATLTFSSEGDEISMSEYTTGKINVEEPALQPLEAGLDFGFLPPESTSQLGLLITNPNNRPLDWEIKIGKLAWKKLQLTEGTAGKESFSTMEAQGISLSQTEGQYPPSHEGRWDLEAQGIISFSQSAGQLPASGSQTVYVTVDSTNLEPGYSYWADLALTSQTAQSTVNVGATFYVTQSPGNDGGPRAPQDLPHCIDYTIHSGQAITHTLNFTNAEPEQVNWEILNVGATWLVPKHLTGTMAPNGLGALNLTTTKLGVGEHQTSFNLRFTWSNRTGETDVNNPGIHFFLAVQ